LIIAPHRSPIRRGDGDDHLVHPLLLHELLDFGDRSEDRYAVNLQSPLAGIVEWPCRKINGLDGARYQVPSGGIPHCAGLIDVVGSGRENPIDRVTIFSYTLCVTKLPDELERLRRNPKGVRFTDLERVILRAGFTLDRSRGSHRVYVRASRILTVVKPHGRHTTCHPRDVRDVIRFLEDDT